MTKCFIRIISIPEGEAPESIRRAWVGLTLPTSNMTDGKLIPQYGVVSGKRVPSIKGYVVSIQDALIALEKTDQVAKEWWETNAPGTYTLVFDEKWCEIVPD